MLCFLPVLLVPHVYTYYTCYTCTIRALSYTCCERKQAQAKAAAAQAVEEEIRFAGNASQDVVPPRSAASVAMWSCGHGTPRTGVALAIGVMTVMPRPELQPYAPEAATVCTRGLQPYAIGAATVCTRGLSPCRCCPNPNPNPKPNPNPNQVMPKHGRREELRHNWPAHR